MNSIEVKGVSKNYSGVQALKNVNLTFEEGKIYGLLGRNGAGKTTLLNIITGRLFPSAGQVFINGLPLNENDELHRSVFMTGDQSLYPDNMRVRDIFKWTKNFYPEFDDAYALSLSQRFGLNTSRKYRALSTGFRSIAKLVTALCVNVPFLIFDEPVLGLDANNRDLFYKVLIEHYAQRPCTVIISTHLIEEVSAIIEDVVIIREGDIIRSQSRDELLQSGFTVSGAAGAVDAFISGRQVLGSDTLGGLRSAYVLGQPGEIPEGLEISRLDLQRLFIQLTNS